MIEFYYMINVHICREKAKELTRKKKKTPTSTDGSSASKREKFSGKNYAKFLLLHIMSLNNQCIK